MKGVQSFNFHDFLDDAECTDERQECEAWARHEHCDINPDYMLKSCKKACGVCQNTREDTNVGRTTTVAGRDDRSHNDDETIVNDGGSRDRNTNTSMIYILIKL